MDKKVLVFVWVFGKLGGMYLCVLAVAMLGGLCGGLMRMLGTVLMALCVGGAGLILMCLGQACKATLHEEPKP